MEAIAWVLVGVLLAMAVARVRSSNPARRRDVMRGCALLAPARVDNRCRCEVCHRQ
jgi:hypothetical protein